MVSNMKSTCPPMRSDFALTTADPMFEDLSYEEVMRDRYVLLCGAGTAIELGKPVWSETALNAMALISMPRGSSTRHYIDAAFFRNNVQFRSALELSDLATIAAFVKAGCGIALLPHLGRALSRTAS
jgi:DNA-binding transcriptional LysR family regulator